MSAPYSPDQIEQMIRQAWDRLDRLSNWEASFIGRLYSALDLPKGHPARRISRTSLLKLMEVHGSAMVREKAPAMRRRRGVW